MRSHLIILFNLLLTIPALAQEIKPLPGSPALHKVAPNLSKSFTEPPKILTAEEKRLKLMVRKAIENIPQNYPNKLHQMEGFYRMVSTEKQKYTKLIEAAFTVQDGSYNAEVNSLNTKIDLKHLRQTTETGNIDSSILAGRKRIYQAWKRNNVQVATPNYLYRIHRSNQIRIAHNPKTVLGTEGFFAEGHSFKLTDKVVVNQDTIYHITYVDNFMPGNAGYLKINATNFAIVEFYRPNFLFGDFMGTYHLKYRQIDGKYYPEFIQVVEPRIINTDIGEHQVDIHTTWIDTVLTQKFTKIKERNQLDWSVDLHDIQLPYDPAFWSGYKMLQRHPLESKMRSSLEREDSLEYQFRENATKVRQ